MVVNEWVRSRFLTINAYMDVSKKVLVKSRDMLFIIGMLILQRGLPFIVMGVWKNTPEALASSGWFQQANAYVVALEKSPCCTATEAE